VAHPTFSAVSDARSTDESAAGAVSPWRTWALRCGGPAGAPPRATGWPRPVELAREHAAHALAHRANDELVAAGARPRATPASKLCVAGMAPEGLSNNEIAEAVFVMRRRSRCT
jgi:hypothetical protein